MFETLYETIVILTTSSIKNEEGAIITFEETLTITQPVGIIIAL